jgi:hypothetical protein
VFEICPHKWLRGGLVYSFGSQRPGSGARDMVYEDWFYCERCLTNNYINRRVIGNSYAKPVDGALPK